MTDSPTLEQLKAMRNGLRDLPGWTVRAEMEAHARSLRVFTGNDRELARFLGQYQEPANAVHLWALDNVEGFERFLDEIDRLLHNLLSSAMTLRDHTRRVRRKLLPACAEDNLSEKYEVRVDKDFGQAPLPQFVEDLRNFTLHRRLPVATGGLSVTPGVSFETRIVLHPSDLLKWSTWSPVAKRYVESAGDEILMASVLRDYRATVVAFQQWFREALAIRHRAELETLEEEEANVRKLWQRAWGPAPSDPG